MPETREQAKNIGLKIRLYTKKVLHDHYTGADDQPALWRKPEFLAQVLFHASEQRYYAPDIKVLQETKDEFTSATQLKINLDSLYEREWLQTVTGIVHISTTVCGSIHSLRRVKDCKGELLFLRTLKTDKSESLSLIEFDQHIEKYNRNNANKLDMEKAKIAHLISLDGDNVKINNVGYYNPIIDNWNEFLFLDSLYGKIYGGGGNLIITKKKLTEIHKEHSRKYALTPSLSDMLALGLATETSDVCTISMFNGNYCSHDNLDEAGAILWRVLNTHGSALPQDEIMMKWCRKMVIKSDHHFDVFRYLSRGERDPFNRAAVGVIMQEKSLDASPTELRKAILDSHNHRDLMSLQYAERLAKPEFAMTSNDAFDAITAISKAQQGTTEDYLYFAQPSRLIISYLVGQIIKSHSCEDYQMDRINDLAPNIHHKPYLLWTLCFWIWEWKPELVPALMRNTSITSALFLIQNKFNITQHAFESATEIKFAIASELFKHLLTVLQSDLQTSLERKAKVIFDCLINTDSQQYQIKGQAPKPQRDIRTAAVRIANDIKYELEERSNHYSVYDNNVHAQEKYYPVLLKELFALTKKWNPESNRPNSTLDFNYGKISLLLFLSKLSVKIPVDSNQFRLASYEIARAIADSYTKTISATSAPSLDYDTWQIKQTIPIFIPASTNIESIDWGSAYILLEEASLPNQFLYPTNLNFNETGDEYDSYNRFVMDKLRAHLKVLILTYRQLKAKEIELKQSGIPIENYLFRLQTAIIDIVVPNSLNDPSKGCFDIFNAIDERPTLRGVQEELIPQIGELSNYFAAPERKKLVDNLLRTDTLIRLVKLIETMSSEQDQRLLLTYFNRLNLREELEKLYSLYDVQFLLSTLTKHVQYLDKAKEILIYWNTNIVPQKLGILTNEITATTYRSELLLAFHANDLKAIEEVPEPENDIFLNGSWLYRRNEKDFYRALYHFQNDNPEQAYSLFNDLVFRKNGDTTTVALNRFAAKLQLAGREVDLIKKNSLFSEALNEWNSYQKNLPNGIALDHIAQSLLYNRLVAFDVLKRYNDFDSFYSGLNQTERVKKGFFEIGVRNKLERKMIPEAIDLIKEAEKFHKLNDGTVPDFVDEMINLVAENDDPETLKKIISTLLMAKPDILAKIIPDSVNDGKDPNSLILNYIVSAATDMLSNINAIAKVSDEDKYSDLMSVALNSAMKYHHWKVSPARGGFSDSSLKNPGEIDLKIQAGNNDELAICEALNLSGENNYEVGKHNIKIFNYTPSKQGLFMLVYYKGPERNYLSSWAKYKNSVKNNVEFPESYQIEKDSFVDCSNKHNIAAIRVGTSAHGNGIILHHVFININYRVQQETV